MSRRALWQIIAAVAVGASYPGWAFAQSPRAVDDPYARMEYFYRQRSYPSGRIPPGALQSARAAYVARWPAAALGQKVQAASILSGWVSYGPRPVLDLFEDHSRYAGRIASIAVDRSNSRRVLIGAADGGVWETLDGGANWTPKTDGECSLAMGSVTIDPANSMIIYAGTGDFEAGGGSYFGCGVLRSTDGGNTWRQLGASVFAPRMFGASKIIKILVDATTAGSATSSVVFAATDHGLFRSTDSGETWMLVLSENGSGLFTDIVQNPLSPSILYAASWGGGVYLSINGGVAWQKLSGGLPAASEVGRIQLAIAASLPWTVYAAVQQFRAPYFAIFKTQDGGGSWIRLSAAGATCGQCGYNLVIAVHPTNPDFVLFGAVYLYRSTDGGASFTMVSSSIHVDQHALAFGSQDPSVILVGNDGGVYRSADGGLTWADLNSSLAITQLYPGISVFPGGSHILGGTQDNGVVEYEGSPAWARVLGGDGGFTAVDPANPATAYAETQWGSNSGYSGPRRRDSYAGGFQLKTNGINLGDGALFIPPLVMDPFRPDVLYFGTDRLYRTRDRGDSWEAISPSLGSISTIAAASDTQTVYVGTGFGSVQVTQDGGVSWSPANSGLPARWVTEIIVDPADPRRAYTTVSGFQTGHVFRTVDGGRVWQDISSNLVDVPANAVFRHPSTGALYVGTDLGAFVSTDSGQTWGPAPVGLPNVPVLGFAFDPVSGTLYAATYGRGVYAYSVGPAVLRGDINLDMSVNTLDAQAVLAGVVGVPLQLGWVYYPNGDADCDGHTGAKDAQVILSYVVGLPTPGACVGAPH